MQNQEIAKDLQEVREGSLPSTILRSKSVVYTAIVTVFACSLSLLYILRPKPGASVIEQRIPQVTTVPYHRGDDRAEISLLGRIQGEHEITLSPEVAGKIVEMHDGLRDGGLVSEDSVLIKLDARPFETRLRQLTAERSGQIAHSRALRKRLERLETLSEEQFVSSEQEEEIRAQSDVSDADVDRLDAVIAHAQLDLERSVLRAPFDAAVLEVFAGPGQVVQPSQVIAKLASLSSLDVTISLRQDQVRMIEGAESVDISVIGVDGAAYDALLIGIAQSLDEQTRLIDATVRIKNDHYSGINDLPRLGDMVDVRILLIGIGPYYEIPRSAIHDENSVYHVVNGKLKKASVSIKLSNGETVYVASDDLQVSGELVIDYPASVREGMLVNSERRQAL